MSYTFSLSLSFHGAIVFSLLGSKDCAKFRCGSLTPAMRCMCCCSPEGRILVLKTIHQNLVLASNFLERKREIAQAL